MTLNVCKTACNWFCKFWVVWNRTALVMCKLVNVCHLSKLVPVISSISRRIVNVQWPSIFVKLHVIDAYLSAKTWSLVIGVLVSKSWAFQNMFIRYKWRHTSKKKVQWGCTANVDCMRDHHAPWMRSQHWQTAVANLATKACIPNMEPDIDWFIHQETSGKII